MTKATFNDNTTINVIAKDGEVFTLKTYLPVPIDQQANFCRLLVHSFEKNFEDDKTSMVYWVLMDMMGKHSLSFYYGSSDRDEERERLGARIRQLREAKGMEAKQLAILAHIDPANLSRIEQGRYSVGFDILTRIGTALGVKVNLV
ncbi:MAG: helix-turn-helix domain-containing protein [Bacteroidota bacterium]